MDSNDNRTVVLRMLAPQEWEQVQREAQEHWLRHATLSTASTVTPEVASEDRETSEADFPKLGREKRASSNRQGHRQRDASFLLAERQYVLKGLLAYGDWIRATEAASLLESPEHPAAHVHCTVFWLFYLGIIEGRTTGGKMRFNRFYRATDTAKTRNFLEGTWEPEKQVASGLLGGSAIPPPVKAQTRL